jgi:hypothetical protein
MQVGLSWRRRRGEKNMRRALDRRRRAQKRIAAVLTVALAVASGVATFGIMSAIGVVNVIPGSSNATVSRGR